MVGIIFLGEINLCPFLNKYVDSLKQNHMDYEIISWDRGGQSSGEYQPEHVHGHVVTNANTTSVTGNAKVYGVLYAPNAATTISNSGAIYGQLVTNSLDISGSGSISYVAAAVTDFNTNVKSIISKTEEATAPTIITQPSSLTAYVGDAVTLSVEASVTKGNLSYQWYSSSSNSTSDGLAISGATNGSYTPSTTAAGTTYYYCIITNTLSASKATTTSNIVSAIVSTVPVAPINHPNDLIPDNNPVVSTPIVDKLGNEAAYIYGKSDTTMAPEEPIIRCEASALLYRLLKQNNQLFGYQKSDNVSFKDLSTSDWYYTSMEFMTYLGVYNPTGSSDRVAPYQAITRGEAAKIFVFAIGLPYQADACNFSDLDTSNKYYKYINALVADGYISGDKGTNTVRPDDVITRAEFTRIYNVIIGRDDKYDITTDVDGNTVVCPFTDLDSSAWYYNDMMRAANSFTNYKIDPSKKAARNTVDDYTLSN